MTRKDEPRRFPSRDAGEVVARLMRERPSRSHRNFRVVEAPEAPGQFVLRRDTSTGRYVTCSVLCEDGRWRRSWAY